MHQIKDRSNDVQSNVCQKQKKILLNFFCLFFFHSLKLNSHTEYEKELEKLKTKIFFSLYGTYLQTEFIR